MVGIDPTVFSQAPLADGTTYIFPSRPPNVLVPPEPDSGECEAAPEQLALSYKISAGHELRFGASETGHRGAILSLGTPGASNDQRYGYDIVAVDQDGNFSAEVDGDCEAIEEPGNTDSFMWGQQVVAVAAGNIVNLDIGHPTNPQPGVKLDGIPRGGNSITIDHGNGEFSRYSHMQDGTIPADLAALPCPADKRCTVAQGDLLGLAGNSGNSEGPHLHFVLMDGSNADVDEGRPVFFNNIQFDGILQTSVSLHTGTTIEDVLPAPSKIVSTSLRPRAAWRKSSRMTRSGHIMQSSCRPLFRDR